MSAINKAPGRAAGEDSRVCNHLLDNRAAEAGERFRAFAAIFDPAQFSTCGDWDHRPVGIAGTSVRAARRSFAGWLTRSELVVAFLRSTPMFRGPARRRRYATQDEARADVFDYIEWFYNPRRHHSKMGQVSPDQFEQANEDLGVVSEKPGEAQLHISDRSGSNGREAATRGASGRGPHRVGCTPWRIGVERPSADIAHEGYPLVGRACSSAMYSSRSSRKPRRTSNASITSLATTSKSSGFRGWVRRSRTLIDR